MPSHPGLRTLGSIAAAVCALAWPAQDALALTLGRIAVQSTLGQPLKAEIEVPGITADEAASLSATVAPLTAYRSAGVDFNAGLSGTRLELQKRGDRSVLVLTGDRTLNDPFVDLIIEATWASGKVVRNYTVLLDPPDTGRTPPPVAAEPAPTPPAAPVARDAAPTEPAPTTSPRQASRAPASRAPAAASKPAASGEQTVTVKPGDTAARIASANKPTNVSLDQMLVGLLQQNPSAFAGQNVNRLRAGEVLSLPSPGQLDAISPQEASKTIVAQSRDFNNYRRQLAGSVAPKMAAAPDREARGKVQAQVQESKAAPAVPDKLTLSKAGATAATPKSSEAQIAGSKEAKDQSTRVAELSKNLSELNRLKAASTEAAGAASAASAPSTGLTAPLASPLPVAPASQPVPAASAPAPAMAAASVAASTPVVAAAPAPAATPKPAPAKEPTPEPGFLDGLFGGSSLLPIGGSLLLVLLGFGFLQMRQRQKAEPSSTIYPDSQFDVDPLSGTGRSRDPVSSMGYSPSQLDAAGDVDPVEEADVYLAYGRDMQAEEILKEALQRTPHRLAVHLKLLDIYAKRQDVAAFDRIAVEARALTDGKGTDWDRISAQGHALSPGNPAYRAAPVDLAATFPLSDTPAPASDLPPVAPASVPMPAGLDLSLDFPSNDETTLIRPSTPAAPAAAAPSDLSDPLPELEFTPDPAPVAAPPAVVAPAPTTAPAAAHLGAMEFDLDSLSLDTSATTLSPTLAAAATPSDPLDVKLELAVEFLAIGDTDGARALVQEVLANSSGAVKARAEQMLADLKA